MSTLADGTVPTTDSFGPVPGGGARRLDRFQGKARGWPGGYMDENQARHRLLAERAEVRRLVEGTEAAGQQDREEERETGDLADSAQPLTAEATDDAVAASLRDRLGTLDRALQRLDDGTYGRSVRSGLPIPDQRLEVDPAAELTVEEARARQ